MAIVLAKGNLVSRGVSRQPYNFGHGLFGNQETDARFALLHRGAGIQPDAAGPLNQRQPVSVCGHHAQQSSLGLISGGAVHHHLHPVELVARFFLGSRKKHARDHRAQNAGRNREWQRRYFRQGGIPLRRRAEQPEPGALTGHGHVAAPVTFEVDVGIRQIAYDVEQPPRRQQRGAAVSDGRRT